MPHKKEVLSSSNIYMGCNGNFDFILAFEVRGVAFFLSFKDHSSHCMSRSGASVWLSRCAGITFVVGVAMLIARVFGLYASPDDLSDVWRLFSSQLNINFLQTEENGVHGRNLSAESTSSTGSTMKAIRGASWRSVFTSNENNTSPSPSLWSSLLNAGKTILKDGSGVDMSRQKGAHEKDFLKLHVCNEVFEAYSASFLTTKQHLIAVDSLGYNLSWVNCEMASFIHMKDVKGPSALKTPQRIEGLIMQSLDVLDFSVIHLSTYERVHKKYQKQLWSSIKDGKARQTMWSNIDVVKTASNLLAKDISHQRQQKTIHWSPEALRTVVVMPFLGGAMGAGHSVLLNRYIYLEACFWSFYRFIPNIIVSVTTEADVEWARNSSGMPFYDVFLLKNLPKGASLPVGTTQEVKRQLVSGKLDFDYIFYTESDQILLWREPNYYYDYLKKFPQHMMLPHRLMAYSTRSIAEVHLRPLSRNIVSKPEELSNTTESWNQMSCCLPRQNCGNRKNWVSIKSPEVHTLNYFGIEVPLGNVNFLDEMYRSCKLTDERMEYCP